MPKYKLHPISAVIEGFKSLKGALLPFIIIFAANGFKINFNIRDDEFWTDFFPIAILLVAMILSFISGFLKWLTFRYWFEDSELRVQYGLFVKKNRFIPFDRIQTLNYKEGIFHRIFGLVQVSVETAGGNSLKAEAELIAIKIAEANRIEQEMNKAKHGQAEVEAEVVLPEKHVIYEMKPLELVRLATTSGGIGVILAGVFTVFFQVADIIPFERILGEVGNLVEFGIGMISILIFMGLLAAWIISIALTMLNYYDFKVAVENERIVITRGLLEKKRVTVPINRIQAISIVENPLRQMFGWATVQLETAGGQITDKGEINSSVKLFPLIVKKQMYTPLEKLFPQYNFDAEHRQMVKPPMRARPFFYRLNLLLWLPVAAVVSYFFFPYGLFSLLIFVPTLLLGFWQHKTAAFTMTDQQITIVERSLSKKTFITEKRRIQSMSMRQTYFQKRRGIATAQVLVMSGISGTAAEIKHMELAEMERCMGWYERTPRSEQHVVNLAQLAEE